MKILFCSLSGIANKGIKSFRQLYCLPSAKTRFSIKEKVIICISALLCWGNVFAANKTSTGTGNWNSASSWSPSGAPANGDNVIIAAGHTITINTNTTTIASLTISGTLKLGNNNTDRTIKISGNLLINGSGYFYSAGNGGNEVEIGGNFTNNGSFDMNISSADANVIFNGAANQFISGTGSPTDFNTIEINNSGSTGNNIVEFSPASFSAVNGFLTLSTGIIKMSGNYTFSNTFFNTANPVIHADEGFWLNNPNVTVTGQNGDTGLYGLLRISAGTYNIGVGADWWLYYLTGSEFIMDGGALNVTGAFFGYNTSDKITYTQTGGTVTVSTMGNNYSIASFEIWNTGSVFSMSGGNIVMQKAATAFTDYVNYSTNATVTGGKIQAGNGLTVLGSNFWINTTPPIYDLEISLTNNPLFMLRNNTTVLHDVNIGGILDAASQDITINVGHDWVNNGVFLPASTGSVIFSGNTQQKISGLLPPAFKNITFANTGGGILLNNGTSVSGTATFTAGIVTSTALQPLTFLDNATTTGANNNVSNPSFVSGPVVKVGNDAFTFPVGKTGAGFHPCGISSPWLITDIFTAEYMRASATALGNISAPGLYHVSNCDYWNISRTLGISSVDVTLSWNGTSNCNAAAYVNNLSSLVIAHFNGSNWNSYGVNSTTGNVSSGAVTWNGVSSFSSFSLGSNTAATNPLPVKFSNIKAYAIGINNKIEWTNQTEDGMEKYEIEKSNDGGSFVKMNTLVARNTGLKEDYTDVDYSVNNNTAWYRIKAIEVTGEVIYSPIVKVNRGITDNLKLNIYPNPVVGNQFTLQLNSSSKTNYLITIINQVGQQVLSANWEHNGGVASRSIELPSAIAPGIYLLIITGGEKYLQSKIIVQ